MTPLTVTVPGVRVQSEMNLREHWTKTNRRKHDQQEAVFYSLFGRMKPSIVPRLRVTTVRLIGPRGKEFDTDNLASSFKFVRDAIAAWLLRDDGPNSGVEWVTAQERADGFGVRIQIEELTGE
jgi:hypothetical protein